jgi:multicomponent Na+:H+ antiporter subunit E
MSKTLLWLRHGTFRMFLFALLWWVLTDRAMTSWWFGAPTVALATITSLVLLPPADHTLRMVGLIRFIGFFVWYSLRGGIDVALRAFNPRLPLDPALIIFSPRLKERAAQIVLVNMISLLPGTLSADLEDNRVRVHVLATGAEIGRSLQQVESVVAALFGIAPTPTVGESEAVHA